MNVIILHLSEKEMKPLFRPRLPESAREKIKSGGVHRNKKAHHRSVEKRNFERQLKDIFK